MAAKTDNAVAEANWVAYQRARDSGHDKWLEVAKKCDDFYLGEQWEESDRSALEAEGRPVLTINEVLKVVNAFLGKQSKQRADLVFKPKRDANSQTAKALTQLTEQILDHNKYEFLEKEVFEDGIILDRGYFDLRMSFDDNIMGDAKVRTLDPYEVMPDPDAKSYDPEGWNSVIVTRWMTLDDIEANYGKAKRVEVESTATTSYESYGEDSVRYDGRRTFGDEDFSIQPDHREDETIRSVRIIERQYRRLATVTYFVDNVVGDMKRVPDDLDPAKVQEIAKQTGVSIIRKIGSRIRWTTTADSITLHDSWSPYRSFTVVPYFPFFRKGKTSGIVRQLLSPQEQFNKMESQMLHIVNTTANSGWIYEEGSLLNMTTEELEERGAETGIVMAVKRGSDRPEKIKANEIPTGLDRLASRSQGNVAGIAGVEGLVGQPAREVSGVALNQLEARGLIQVDVPFDSLKRTRALIAHKMMELIQDFYTETRILRVTLGNGGFGEEDQELVINGVNAAGEIVNDMTLGEYDITVGTRPARDNFEDMQFATSLQMREAGVMIPDDVVIRHSPLDDKDAIADRVAGLQGVAPPTPEEIELAAKQLQLEMRTAELEAGKIEAEISELQSRAAMAFAKAQSLEGEAQIEAMQQALDYKVRLADLQSKLQMFYDNLENKLQLAGIHARNKRETTAMQESTRHSIKELEILTKPVPPAPQRAQ